MSESYKKLVSEAAELAEFFLGTYAHEAISTAVETKNEEILRIVMNEFQSQRQLIEEQQARSEDGGQ